MSQISSSNDVQLYNQANSIIENARNAAFQHVNLELVRRNWMLGKLIDENELSHDERAPYGLKVIETLSTYLTERHGKGFSKRDLYNYLSFYRSKPELFRIENQDNKIVYSVSAQSTKLLSWTHYRTLLQETDANARDWYEQGSRDTDLERKNTPAQHKLPVLPPSLLSASQHKSLVRQEMKEHTSTFQQPDTFEFIKNPVIGEFLGFTADSLFRESELEQAIISNLEKFILELGKGFAFVADSSIYTPKRKTTLSTSSFITTF